MPPRRAALAISLVSTLALVGLFSGPAARGADARNAVVPSALDHVFSPPRVASQSTGFGSLRGVDPRALVARFSRQSRHQAFLEAGQPAATGTVNVNNWTLTPAGSQSDLGDLPLNAVPSPDGRTMLVVNSGAGVQSLQVVDMTSGSVLQTLTYTSPHSVFVGAAYSPDGKQAFVSGGGENTIHTYSVGSDGTLTPGSDISEARAPASLSAFSTSSYPTGLSISPDGKAMYVANSNVNNVAVVNTASRAVTATIPVGYAPYTTFVEPRTGLVYASNWGDGTLSVIDPKKAAVVATIPVGQHPSAMAFDRVNGMLYVSDSNSDAVSVVDPARQAEIARVSVVGNSSLPLGASPQGLTVSPDGRSLYVALAGDNAVADLALAADGSAYFQGWIPTGWYPTDVTVNPDGSALFVTNGFGQGEHANNGPLDPNPTRPTPSTPLIQQPGYCSCTLDQFTGTMDVGTLSTVPVPGRGELRSDTIQVAENDHFFDVSPGDRSAGNPIPLDGGASPIKHVIYIVKENRTYDQVLGDEPAGKGDASLTLFPKAVTPNIHALAERFGLLDNFYADAQVSADGHNWTLSANASDANEKLWPQDYSTPTRNYGYPFEGGSTLVQSPGGYLWDDAAAAGITYRDYGLYAVFDNPSAAVLQSENATCAGPITHTYLGVTIPAGQVLCFPPTTVNQATSANLVGHIDPQFINYDMRYPDMERVAEWKREFATFVTNNNLPALEFVRLSNDHTQGTRAGAWTPQRYASDNDAAVGQLVDTVSHSKYWADTAIFVVEDDAQNGPDHLDSHRTEALVISPYTSQSTARADSTHYDTASMVRTIELILGLKPLSQYDATATPMWRLFSAQPDSTPYSAASQAVTSGTESDRAFGSKESERLNWALPDQAWAPALNRILWHAVKGAKTPYPGPIPYGIPAPSVSGYTWGALATRSYPLLGMHGSTRLRILHR